MAECRADSIRIAIIAARGAEASADLLTAELSSLDEVVLLERQELETIAVEGGLRQASLTKASRESDSRIEAADGVLLVETIATGGREYLSGRLVAVRPGVVVTQAVAENKAENFQGWARELAQRVDSSRRKLLVEREKAIAISLLNLRFAFEEQDEVSQGKANALARLLTRRLATSPEIFILERDNLGEVAWERALCALEPPPLWKSRYLLEGILSETETSTKFELSLRPSEAALKKEAASFEFEVPMLLDEDKADGVAFVEAVANQMTDHLREAGLDALPGQGWDSGREGELFFREARWFFNLGLIEEANRSLESANFLGYRESLENSESGVTEPVLMEASFSILIKLFQVLPQNGQVPQRRRDPGAGSVISLLSRSQNRPITIKNLHEYNGIHNDYEGLLEDGRASPTQLEAMIKATELMAETSERTQREEIRFREGGNLGWMVMKTVFRMLENEYRHAVEDSSLEPKRSMRLRRLRKMSRRAVAAMREDPDNAEWFSFTKVTAPSNYIEESAEDGMIRIEELLNGTSSTLPASGRKRMRREFQSDGTVAFVEDKVNRLKNLRKKFNECRQPIVRSAEDGHLLIDWATLNDEHARKVLFRLIEKMKGSGDPVREADGFLLAYFASFYDSRFARKGSSELLVKLDRYREFRTHLWRRRVELVQENILGEYASLVMRTGGMREGDIVWKLDPDGDEKLFWIQLHDFLCDHARGYDGIIASWFWKGKEMTDPLKERMYAGLERYNARSHPPEYFIKGAEMQRLRQDLPGREIEPAPRVMPRVGRENDPEARLVRITKGWWRGSLPKEREIASDYARSMTFRAGKAHVIRDGRTRHEDVEYQLLDLPTLNVMESRSLPRKMASEVARPKDRGIFPIGRDIYIGVPDALWKLDSDTGEWMRYEVELFRPRQVAFFGGRFFSTFREESPMGAGIIESDLTTGKRRILASSMRNPSQCVFDSPEAYQIAAIFPLPEGMLGVHRNHELFKMDPESLQATVILTMPRELDATRFAAEGRSDEWYTTMLRVPGPGSGRYYVASIHFATGEIRQLLSPTDEAETSTSGGQVSRKSLFRNPAITEVPSIDWMSGHSAVAYDGERLFVMGQRGNDWYSPTLHYWRNGKEHPVTLDLAVAVHREKNEAVDPYLAAKLDQEVTQGLDEMYLTKDCLVLVSKFFRGFLRIKLEDIDRAVDRALESPPTPAQGQHQRARIGAVEKANS